jgi:hypothetical protein
MISGLSLLSLISFLYLAKPISLELCLDTSSFWELDGYSLFSCTTDES